jgi:hypothetical protein
MAHKSFFNNRIIRQPGVYSQIKSGISNPPLPLAYGNIVLIDTGIGAFGYGLGSGIEGILKQRKNSIEYFDNLDDLRKYLRGGLFWGISKNLFYPSKDKSIKGITGVYYVKAAKTTPAELILNFGDESMSDLDVDNVLDGGQIILQMRHEGTVGNGFLTGGELTKGFASKMKVGIMDTNKFIMDFYAATFKGLDSDLEPYTDTPGYGVLEADSIPEVVASSKEFSTVTELANWMNSNSVFNQWFKVKSFSSLGTGRIDATDLTALSSYQLFSGGTQTYNQTYLADVLDSIADLDYTFVFSDRYQDHALDYINDDIKTHLESESLYGEFLIIGGGKDSNYFEGTNSSIEIAQHFDSSHVVVCHSGPKKNNTKTGGFKEYDSIYKAALVLGRIAGKEPQVPGTFKDLDMDGDIHLMNNKEKDKALDFGVLYSTYDTGDFIIGQAISSMQDNEDMIDSNGVSYEISIMRIANQLNKELAYNIKRTLLRAESGVNRNTLSAEVLKNYMINFMATKTADSVKDNLIIKAQNYKVVLEQDSWKLTYEFIPNTPINKVFLTGFMIQ